MHSYSLVRFFTVRILDRQGCKNFYKRTTKTEPIWATVGHTRQRVYFLTLWFIRRRFTKYWYTVHLVAMTINCSAILCLLTPIYLCRPDCFAILFRADCSAILNTLTSYFYILADCSGILCLLSSICFCRANCSEILCLLTSICFCRPIVLQYSINYFLTSLCVCSRSFCNTLPSYFYMFV